MEVALDMLLPVLAGMFAGLWLHENWGWNIIIVPVLAVVGMLGGLRVAYKRAEAMRLSHEWKKLEQKDKDSNEHSKLSKSKHLGEKIIRSNQPASVLSDESPVKAIYETLSPPSEDEPLDKDLY